MALGMNDFRSIVIKADAANTSIAPIRLSQNDQDGRRIVFELWNGAESIAATGLTARLLFGVGEGGYATMTAVSGAPTATWAVDVPQEALQTAGVVRMAVEVASGSQAVCTRIFDAVVEPALIDEDSPEAQDALSEFREAVARLDGLTIPIPVNKGGTGSTSAANARTALGITPANIGALPTALGGTVAGTINLMSNNIDRDGANPSSDAVGRLYQLVDKDGERIGFLRATHATDGSISLALAAFAESTGGVEQSNWLTLRAAKDGSNTVIVTEPSAWRSGLGITPANIGAVNKAGDTMTGSLIETGVNLYVDTPTLDPTDPEATTYQSGFGVVMRDKDGKNAGVVRAIRNTVRSTGLNIFGQRIVNGTNITNQLSLLVREDGSLAVDVSDKKVWAEMIGCTAAVISKNSSWTTTFSGSSCLVTISRGSYYAVGIIDYWSTSMNVIMQSSGAQTVGLPTITKSANSYSFTIINDHNSVSIAVDVISIPAQSV